MLKGQSGWIPWIYRGFLIVMMITVIWRASVNTMEDVDVTVSGGAEEYRLQAAAMQVVNHEDRKAVIDSFNEQDTNRDLISMDGPGCDIEGQPGFPYNYVIATNEGGWAGCELGADAAHFGHFYISPQDIGNDDIHTEIQEFQVVRNR